MHLPLMGSWHDWIPRCTAADVDKAKANGRHVSECCTNHEGCGYHCDGYLGPLETYMCICWCHLKSSPDQGTNARHGHPRGTPKR